MEFNSEKRQKSIKEVRLAVAALKAHIFEGLDQEEIMAEEEWDEKDYDFLVRKMYEQETSNVEGRKMSEVYVDYMITQGKCIRELDKVQKKFGQSKQYNALVGAIKAKSDIYDKIINRGQEFGFIQKTPDKLEFVGSMAVRSMSEEELKTRMEKEIIELAALQNSRIGDTITLTDDGLEIKKGESSRKLADIINITPKLKEIGEEISEKLKASNKKRKSIPGSVKLRSKLSVKHTGKAVSKKLRKTKKS